MLNKANNEKSVRREEQTVTISLSYFNAAFFLCFSSLFSFIMLIPKALRTKKKGNQVSKNYNRIVASLFSSMNSPLAIGCLNACLFSIEFFCFIVFSDP